MKTLVVVASGAADRPLEELGGRTPLEAAATPMLDRLAHEGRLGRLTPAPVDVRPEEGAFALGHVRPRPAVVRRHRRRARRRGVRRARGVARPGVPARARHRRREHDLRSDRRLHLARRGCAAALVADGEARGPEPLVPPGRGLAQPPPLEGRARRAAQHRSAVRGRRQEPALGAAARHGDRAAARGHRAQQRDPRDATR